jgi:hypothetical protein
MRAERLQLVIPRPLHETYRDDQRSWLMTLADFVGLVSDRQQASRKILRNETLNGLTIKHTF